MSSYSESKYMKYTFFIYFLNVMLSVVVPKILVSLVFLGLKSELSIFQVDDELIESYFIEVYFVLRDISVQ
jgi:hypothetical protein